MIIEIKVNPCSKEQKIIKLSEKQYKVFLKSLPENQKNNGAPYLKRCGL